MLAEERFARIVEKVNASGTVTVAQLACELGISESTVRRDLDKLDSLNKLTKVHGGAVCLEDAHVSYDLTLQQRSELHADQKQLLARYAASLVGPHDCVYVDSGSTTKVLVDCLMEKGALYVTNSAVHGLTLAQRGFTVVLLGGELKGSTSAMVGPEALDALERYNFTLGFWGANGIDLQAGCTSPEREESQVKRASLARSARRLVLADTSKFGRVAPVSFASLNQVEVLTTSVPEGYEDVPSVRCV